MIYFLTFFFLTQISYSLISSYHPTNCCFSWSCLPCSGARRGASPQRPVLQPGPVLFGWIESFRWGAHLQRVCSPQRRKSQDQSPGWPVTAWGRPRTTGTLLVIRSAFHIVFTQSGTWRCSYLQIDQTQFDKIMDLIESGKRDGATLECGGSAWGQQGLFIQPTVFSDVTDDMRIAKEEVNTCGDTSEAGSTHDKPVTTAPFHPLELRSSAQCSRSCVSGASRKSSSGPTPHTTAWPRGCLLMTWTKPWRSPLPCRQGWSGKSNNIASVRNGFNIIPVETRWSWSCYLVISPLLRVNCYNAMSAQCPFGGFKMSGNGREL